MLPSDQQNEVSIEDVETTVYPRLPGYPNSINFWINDLAEIAGKATHRGEKFLARTAVSAIVETTKYYLSARKQNLILLPDPEALFLAPKSDVEVVVNRAYEALVEVSRISVANGDESTAIRVSEAFQSVGSHTATLGAHAFRSHSAPLTPAPIGYLMSCVKYAESRELPEVPFQSAEILARVSIAAPKDISVTDVHIPVIDGIYEIALYLYTKRDPSLADHVVGHMLTILDYLLSRDDVHFPKLLRHVLEKLEILAPLAVINESLTGRIGINSPLGKAYGLTNPQSVGYLFSKATNVIKIDTESEWVSPYHQFLEIADLYWRHLRNLAEKIEFGDSFLFWELNQLVKHIVSCIADLVDHPLRPGHGDEVELVDKLKWILSFYWVAFNKKKMVHQQHADEACETLAYSGLLFFERGYPDVVKSCVSYIRSIIESYCEAVRPPDDYALGDFFAHLWSLRLLITARQNVALTETVDTALNARPRALTNEQWQQVQEAIELRRSQLEERLGGWDMHFDPNSPEAVLRRLLQVNVAA